jgi:nucleoside-diphosphate-sugar epimerase
MAQRKVVVIGGNGQLGSAATRGAVDAGAAVTVMSRHARQHDTRTVAVKGSIANIDDLRPVLHDADADAVIVSVEADWTPSGLRSVYVDGMRNVLSATSMDAHIVFMGNIGVTDEARMPDYNRAKREAEQGDHYTGRRDDLSQEQLARAIRAILTHGDEAAGKTFELYGGSDEIEWSTALNRLIMDK